MLCCLKGCGKCGGDLITDGEDWKCCQCGRVYYADPGTPMEPGPMQITNPEALHWTFEGSPEPRRRGWGRIRGGRRTRAARSLNSIIKAKDAAEARWWARHQQVIDCLDRGMPVREICSLLDLGQRQVRAVRERLADVRSGVMEIA